MGFASDNRTFWKVLRKRNRDHCLYIAKINSWLWKLACPHWAGVSWVRGVKKGRQDRFREVHPFEISWVESLLLSVLGP